MFRGNQFTAIAAGLALVVGFSLGGYILGFGLGEQSGEKQASTYAYARHAQDEIDSTCARLDGVAQTECIVRVVEATNEHKRSQSDLNAQRNMAKWALLMLFATVAMAIITAMGVYYVWRTLKATQDMAAGQAEIGNAQVRASNDAIKAAQDANQIMRGEQRPWLNIEFIPRIDDSGEVLRLKPYYTIKNVGSRPAIGAKAWSNNVDFMGLKHEAQILEGAKVLARADKMGVGSPLIFPGESTPGPMNFVVLDSKDKTQIVFLVVAVSYPPWKGEDKCFTLSSITIIVKTLGNVMAVTDAKGRSDLEIKTSIGQIGDAT